MIIRRTDPLTYGSLGAAQYDENSLQWTFQRSPHLVRCLHQISPTRALTQPILPLLGADINAVNLDRDKRIRKLLKNEPVLTPLHSTILRLTYASEAIQQTEPDFDPSVSELFAIGEGVFGATRSTARVYNKELRPFLAHPAGQSGESLRITGFIWPEVRDTDAEGILPPIPRLDHKTYDEWTGPNVTPIKQICVEAPLDRSACYVAARKPTETSVFKPRCERPNSKSGLSLQWRTEFLFSIPMAYTGGAEHIDVAFGPWENMLIAILDSLGHWSVFTTGEDGRTYRLITFSAPRPDFESLQPTSNLGVNCDGAWGKVVFAGHSRCLVVCCRQDWGIFTTSTPSHRISTAKIALLEEDDVILDLKRDPANPQLVFILTSSKLFWLRLAEKPNEENPEVNIFPTLITSWHHHWDCTTFVMKLLLSPSEPILSTTENRIDRSNETYTLAMIYGRGIGLLEVFKTSSQIFEFNGFSAADPFLLQIHPYENELAAQSSIAIQFELRDINIPHATTSPNGHRPDSRPDVRYFQLLEINARLGISQTILFYSSTQPLPTELALSPPIYQPKLNQEQNAYESGIHQNGSRRGPNGHFHNSYARFSRKDARRLANYVHKELLKDFNKPLTEKTLLQQLHLAPESSILGQSLVLLHDTVSKNLAINDPKAVSETLHRFLQGINAHDNSELVVASVLTLPMRGMLTGTSSEETRLSFSQVYTYMHRTWITSLPKDISTQAKEALDKYVRSLALETFLCSMSLCPPVSAPAPSLPAASQQAPTTSQTKGKSKVHSSQLSQQMESSGYSPSSNLARLTEIPSTVQDPSDVIARITDEWIIGSDPAEYDWKRVRGIEAGGLPSQQTPRLAEDSHGRAHTAGKAFNTQTTLQSSQLSQSLSQSVSQSQTQSQATGRREGKPQKKRRKGF